MINIQWTKFERKSIVTFISEELPKIYYVVSALQLSLTYQFVYLLKVRKTQPLYLKENASSARQQISSVGNAQFKGHCKKKQAFVLLSKPHLQIGHDLTPTLKK